ncbi:TetR/AcrR family transcriptional regulator [Nocardia takedensis]
MIASTLGHRTLGGRRTRRRLLVAARRLFLTRGFAAVHVIDVAGAAGYTTGALGKHYPYKHMLGHEVAESLTALVTHRLRVARPNDPDELVGLLSAWAQVGIGHPGWIWFELELATEGPEHRDMHHDRSRRVHAALTELLATTIEPAPGVDLTTTAALLIAVLLGLTIAPDSTVITDPHQLRDQIELVLRAATDPASPTTTTRTKEN